MHSRIRKWQKLLPPFFPVDVYCAIVCLFLQELWDEQFDWIDYVSWWLTRICNKKDYTLTHWHPTKSAVLYWLTIRPTHPVHRKVLFHVGWNYVEVSETCIYTHIPGESFVMNYDRCPYKVSSNVLLLILCLMPA